jgi:hypothetical protein
MEVMERHSSPHLNPPHRDLVVFYIVIKSLVKEKFKGEIIVIKNAIITVN